MTNPALRDKIHLVPTGTYALVAQLDRVTDYESVGRGFESLPSHQVKSHDLPLKIRCKSWDFLLYIGFKRAGKCLICALLPQKLPCRVPYRVPCAGCPAGRVFSPVHRLFGGKEKACPVCSRAGFRAVCRCCGSIVGHALWAVGFSFSVLAR